MQKSTTDAVSNSAKPELHEYRCNYCGSFEQVKLFDVERQKKTFSVVRCHCGLVYQNPRPRPEEFDDYYDRDYFEGAKKEFTSWQEFPADLTERIIDLPPIDFTKKGRFLDVGCGIGVYVAYVRDRGWEAKGLDISRYSTDFGRKSRKLDLTCCTLEEAEYEDSYFDAIYMRDVLEHITEPQELLKEVARILGPDGWFYLTTGNFGSVVSRLREDKWFFFQVDHIHYFSLTTLQKMLNSAGLKVVRMGREYPYGRSVSELYRRKAPRLAFRIPEYLLNTRIAPSLFKLFGAKAAEPFAATMSLHCRKKRNY